MFPFSSTGAFAFRNLIEFHNVNNIRVSRNQRFHRVDVTRVYKIQHTHTHTQNIPTNMIFNITIGVAAVIEEEDW